MQITESLAFHLNSELSKIFRKEIKILTTSKLYGGSVNYSYLLQTNHAKYFIKINDLIQFPEMFKLEVEGLNQIMGSKALRVPQIILEGNYENQSYLILEYIEQGKEEERFWNDFAIDLAALHQVKQTKFGLDSSNYIGSLVQKNEQTLTWPSFFAEQRIMSQAIVAFDSGRIDQTLLKQLEQLANKMNSLFPKASPSLLHGDLWSGNFIVNKNARAVVIDPAVCYGNREMDIAMSLLFGGFKKSFYDSYNEVYPLQPDWEKRVDLCNTYPLLVHVNLFGASYSNRLKNAIKRYL